MNKVITIAVIGTIIVIIGLGIAMMGNSSPQQTETSSNTPSLSAETLVLDVRTPAEYSEGHAVRATNLPLQDIQAGKLPSAAKDSKIAVYCRSGNRSAQAVKLLKQAGYSNVQDLGGVEAARSAGLEFTN